jgi:hypothetical protein
MECETMNRSAGSFRSLEGLQCLFLHFERVVLHCHHPKLLQLLTQRHSVISKKTETAQSSLFLMSLDFHG